MQNTFADRLLSWYFSNGRSLPWRETRDPYAIWISEIILQQTRVAQGLDYYHRFLQRFPSIKDLALAEENDVLVMWQGLGYYSRARNLHTAAKTILQKHQGVFPEDYASILQLKGIGEYTASAISAFAYQQPFLAVDGNAYRVFSRYFAIDLPIDIPEGQRIIKELAYNVFDTQRPDHFNQAIMDLGSGICTPKQPRCSECPLQDDCLALLSDRMSELPVKQGKTKQKNRFLTYFVFAFDGQTYLYKRPGGDVWQGLYEFPVIESGTLQEWNDFHVQCRHTFHTHQIQSSEPYLHLLSHQRIHARFIVIDFDALSTPLLQTIAPQCELVHRDQWQDFPVSRLIERFCENENFLSTLEKTVQP